MQAAEKINVFWFRRDLRLDDNTGLNAALKDGLPVLPVFIFDTNILSDLETSDTRVTFIHDTLRGLNNKLTKYGTSILVKNGDPQRVWQEISSSYRISGVFINTDYEPYAIERDNNIAIALSKKGIKLNAFKDQVIFEAGELLSSGRKPYTIFTPYRNKWLKEFDLRHNKFLPADLPENLNFLKLISPLPTLKEIGFSRSVTTVGNYDLSHLSEYHRYRDFPALDKTTHLGPHLRFGTVSIRRIVEKASSESQVFLSELIWREFFMQILYNFPYVVTENFRKKFDGVGWRNDEKEFKRWCNGETGYPMVDAGMRQLNQTGYMHNRVRMITAGFLCKHLLTDWRYGEAYFAEKLNDYELSSNNGNWQWVAGTGFDSSQYFRIFNPSFQQKKFDPHNEFVRRWVPDYDKNTYPGPMVEHTFARKRAIEAYKTF